MGSACCVAARDRTITDRSSNDIVTRNDRYSPSWSFRWDNRVAGEESSINERLDNKSQTTLETTYATEGSPLESSRSMTWQKSPISEENGVPYLDPLNSKNLHEGKDSRGTPTPVALELSPTKMLTPTHSTSSLSASPLSSSQSQLMPLSSLTPSRWPRRSPGHHHLLRQVSDSRIRGMMSPNFSISEDGSPFMHPGLTNKSKTGSHGGSSDGWSNRDRWSFDSESLSFSRERISRSSGRVSSSPTVEIMTCGICSKLLTERSSWSKIVPTNGLPVVSVLICGHAYHAECLENMTPEIYKYDPACPVCTLGEKKVLKLTEKALGVEMDLKGKIGKKLCCRVVDGGSDSVIFDRFTSGRGPTMGSSSSMKSSSSTGKPFLRKHFSFGYKPNRSFSDNGSRKKRFFWTKSSKE